MKYDLSKIMSKAWAIFRKAASKAAISFSEALHRAWLSAKVEPINAARVEAAREAAGISEECNTWAGWKSIGFEVVHGSKALFQAVLIYGSKGDGATYTASFFSRSQVAALEA